MLSARVSVWATVKAVTCCRIGFSRRESRKMPSTKRMWSGPAGTMWVKPSARYWRTTAVRVGGGRRHDLQLGLHRGAVEEDRRVVGERAQELAEALVDRRRQARDGAVARLAGGPGPFVARPEVGGIDRDLDPVGAVLEEGRIDLDLAQFVGADSRGHEDQEGGEQEDGGRAQGVFSLLRQYGSGAVADEGRANKG